jgi:TPR repeat protein
LYHDGKGVTKDRDKAVELWKAAAAKGSRYAKDELEELVN